MPCWSTSIAANSGMMTLVLHPKGAFRLTGQERRDSRLGMTQVTWNWRVIELWTLPARELLAAGDVGLVPWATLAQFDGPPEALIQECQARLSNWRGRRRRPICTRWRR